MTRHPRRRGATRAAWAVVGATLVVATLATPLAWGQGSPTGDHAGVTVTASPRWGRSTPGSWTPYLVTVRNEGRRDVDGEVVLVPDPTPPPAPDSQQGVPSPPAPDDPARPAQVVALGGTEITEAAPPGPPRSPRDFPTYRTPIALAAGGARKTLTLLVAEAPYGYLAEVHDGAGTRIAASRPVPRPRGSRPRPTVALLSQVPGAGAALDGLDDFFGPQSGTVTTLSSARELPAIALHLSGLHAVVIDRFDTAALSRPQVQALHDFVAFGGSLVLAGGADGARAASSLPDDLVPLRPTGTTTASLSPLADLVGRTTSTAAAVVTGELRRGRSVLHAPGGVPLVVQAEYGAGRVVQLAYDPLAEPLASDPDLRDLAWYQGISRAVAEVGGAGGAGGVAPPGQLWSSVLRPSGWPAWPGASLWALAAYAVVAAPLGYAVLRARGRAELVWVAAPLVALVVATTTGLAGGARDSAGAATVEVRTMGGGGGVLVNSYGSLRSLGPTERSVRLGAGAMASTTFVASKLVAGSLEPDLVPSGRGGGVVVADGGRPAEVALPTRPGQTRNLQFVSLAHLPGLDARLRLVGSKPPESGGLRVTGTVANRSPRAVRDLRAQLPEGAQAHLGDVIRPGETLDVDATFVWPRAAPAGSGLRASAAERAMFAAADEAFTRGGRAVVVGLDAAHAAGEVRVVLHVVALDGAENLVADSARAHMVAGLLEPTGARTNVFDLVALPGVGPLDLGYNVYSPAPEVYDWSTGTWRPAGREAPETFEGPARLTEHEVHDGVVRVRTNGDPAKFAYGLALRSP